MSQPKIRELLENCGIDISQSTISRILTNDETGFNQEKKDIFRAALEHTPYHQIDDTTVRVNGKNYYSQIFCNPYYTAFFTVPRKDRLTILDLLLCGRERTYRFDQKAFCLMANFKVSKKMTDVQTAKKLGINAFEYISDRVSKKFSMPALSDLIIERAKLQPG